MKKLILLITLVFLFVSCSEINKAKEEQVKKEILQELPNQIEEALVDMPAIYKPDKFYFIEGLDYDKSPATNIKFRGIIYSDKLKEYGYTGGVEIGLEKLEMNKAEVFNIAGNYLGLLMQIEINSMAENKARELFGEMTNLYNDGMTTEYMFKNIRGNVGKSLSFADKSGYSSTIVNVFVDDLNKLDNEDIKKKTFELAKFIYDDMNYVTALQVYVRDKKYFEDYNLVYYSIYKPFREREDIKAILGKIKNKKNLRDGERKELVRVFNKGGLDFDKCYYEFYLISFNEKNEIPLKYENVFLRRKEKMGDTIYDSWRDDKRQ